GRTPLRAPPLRSRSRSSSFRRPPRPRKVQESNSGRSGVEIARGTSSLGVTPMSEVTRILSAIEQGDPTAAELLLPLVYHELRRLAARRLAQEKPGQTLQASALVHEAYLRLVDVGRARHWNSRRHFLGSWPFAPSSAGAQTAARHGSTAVLGNRLTWRKRGG